ncbi:hypothetical protein A28LD_0257 [Idiomarina sp. A28L]|uniref:hypothetical protein n=1 Tax=Idiomarina sp. A28L TaxID=1036674 RepID=UPI0002138879|nr:hypothetical protein [Idiomarina sp. A28L]EGN76178.1 hypothetical protein A28LD_0257 [Idiomarina sp. A28L]
MMKKILPLLLIGVAVMLFAVMSWLGSSDSTVNQFRPPIGLEMEYTENDRMQKRVADDILYRMQTHHEYRLATSQTGDPVASVQINIERLGNDEIKITANVNGQPIIVEGPAEVALSLSAKMFSLVNNALSELVIAG